MEDIISNLGFPIASVIGLAYYFVQKDKTSREDINKIMDNLREDNKLDKFAIALENNNNKLEAIEDDIKVIKERVGV